MDVKLNSIDNLRPYRHFILADLDFEDEGAVIRDFGAKKCVEALDAGEVFDALGGWHIVQEYYAEEIEALLEEAKCASSQG